MAAPGPPTPAQMAAVGPNDSIASHLLAVTGVCTIFSLLIVSLRVYVRSIMLKAFSTDDWLMLGAMVCSLATFICFIGEAQNGLGRHTIYITPPMMEEINHWQFYHYIVVVLGISLIKLSIAFLLLRFVRVVAYKRFIWVMIAFLTAFTISCVATLIFSCVPPAANWDPSLLPTAKCFSLNTFASVGFMNTAINIFTDVAFVIIPIPVIWGLQLNTKTKISLLGVLSLGIFACAASIVKLYYQLHALTTVDAQRNDAYNVWNDVEINIGIIAACLPSLRPLFKAVLGSTGRFTSNRNNPYAPEYAGGSTNGLRTPRHRFIRQDDDTIGMEGLPRKPATVRISVAARELAPGGRSDSEESILAKNPQSIIKTTDVTIT